MRRILPILLLLAVGNLFAASWYVDNAATGTGSGTSWANAWTNFGSIVWGGAGVVAGDTLYISGGSSSKTYTNIINITASGTSNSPITVAVGQDAGHNGNVIIDGAIYGTNNTLSNAISFHGRNYITINGSVGGTSHLFVQNWRCETSTISPKAFYADPGHFAKILYCTVSNVNVGVYMPSSTNITVGWCDMTIMGDACIAINNSHSLPPKTFDSTLIFSNRFHCIWNDVAGAPDGVQGGEGVSVFHCFFECLPDSNSDTNRHTNHLDVWQSDNNEFVKLYDNEILNIGDSGFSPAPWTAGHGVNSFYIYNNIFHITQQMDPFPQYIRSYNTLGLGGYTNYWIVNNLFIDRTNVSQAIYLGPEIGDAPGTNNVLANNIFVDCGNNPAVTWELEKTSGTGQSQWLVTNNIIYDSGSSPALVKYLGTNWTVTQWKTQFDPSTGTNLPAFVHYVAFDPNNNFNLLASDTNALGKGLDFSAVFTTDYNGTTRTAPWSIGPFQPVIGTTLNVGTATVGTLRSAQ